MDYGNSITPWSVGKYAKRSTTIHLCSEDVETQQSFRFVANVASTAGASNSITIFDIGGTIRTKFATLELPTVSLVNEAQDTSSARSAPQRASLFNGDGVSTLGTDFTKLQLQDVADVAINSALSKRFVRIETATDYNGLGTEGFIASKQPSMYYILLKEDDFPAHADNPKTMLSKDGLVAELWRQQFDKGYGLEIMRWEVANKGDPNHANHIRYYVDNLSLGGFEKRSNIMYVSLTTPTLTSDLKTAVDTLVAQVDAVDQEVYFSGAVEPVKSSGYVWTWNIFPLCAATGSSLEFANSGDNHCNYEVTIPNIIGYPEHKRCLLQVQSLSAHSNAYFLHNEGSNAERVNPVYVGVEIQGLGVQSSFSSHIGTSENARHSGNVNNTQMVGYFNLNSFAERSARINATVFSMPASYGYHNTRSILDDGVLATSPFGQKIRIRFINLTNKSVLDTNSADGYHSRTGTFPDDITRNPTHLTLRILFLDDEDLPMR